MSETISFGRIGKSRGASRTGSLCSESKSIYLGKAAYLGSGSRACSKAGWGLGNLAFVCSCTVLPGAQQLKTILGNTLVNLTKKYQAKKRDVRLERSIDQSLQDSAMRIVGELSAGKTYPGANLLRQKRAEQLAEALARLLENEYQAVTLKHIHGLTVVEIAERLGRTPEGVAGLLRRGLAKLRLSLQELDSNG